LPACEKARGLRERTKRNGKKAGGDQTMTTGRYEETCWKQKKGKKRGRGGDGDEQEMRKLKKEGRC